MKDFDCVNRSWFDEIILCLIGSWIEDRLYFPDGQWIDEKSSVLKWKLIVDNVREKCPGSSEVPFRYSCAKKQHSFAL